MIHIFFVPGMFGSTIEHVLRSYTNEYRPSDGTILEDGSMHSFKKEFHPVDIFAIRDFKNFQPNSITTPIYPFAQTHLPEILDEFESWLLNSKPILIYADSLRSAELNLLFQYYKIAIGLGRGLDIFCGENQHNIVNWNADYTSWKQMQPWELREWFSLFYTTWVNSWIESYHQVPTSFLKISNTEVLFDTKDSLIKIINFCNLTHNSTTTDLGKFVTTWQQKQNYIIEEFNLLDQILETTLNKIDHNWKDLNIIAESIVQQRLRANGYEIRCDGLDIFPTDSISLYNLLEKC
jgi:hypothetical protein